MPEGDGQASFAGRALVALEGLVLGLAPPIHDDDAGNSDAKPSHGGRGRDVGSQDASGVDVVPASTSKECR